MSDKFLSPMPRPTEHEQELTTILVEECTEIMDECLQIIKRATKLMRFGVEEIQPGQTRTNRERLEDEIGDLMAIIQVSINDGLLNKNRIDIALKKKLIKLDEYIQTEKD